MLRHVLLLLFLFGIKNGGGSEAPQEQPTESKDVIQDGIKKNEVSANGHEESNGPGEKTPNNKSYKNAVNTQYTVTDILRGTRNKFSGGNHQEDPQQGISWPFPGHFPIDINDPFLNVYKSLATSMYNSVSSMVEYVPDSDICDKEKGKSTESEKVDVDQQQQRSSIREKFIYKPEQTEQVFDEVTMRSGLFRRKPVLHENQESVYRKRRDATSVFVKSREGDTVGITLEEPAGSMSVEVPDERARSFSHTLVNTPPLSTILRPPQQGYADKRRKTKPSKPIKEESNSEEIGEEHEEESTSQSPESANEAVAISPPPEGASVAEAKPIGLAIAGPGGVAASKPQGTAVAGPGGLAIARPVGTAIAGVDVEGSVPIGGQQKNKKKPKQEQEQTEGELHYVGGLTGPIGNPQPKEFADSIYYKTVKETEANNIQENLLFRGKPNINGFQLRLGQQNGKYGFIPMLRNPADGEGVAQKRTDFPIFFHGLLGNGAPGFDQIQNFQAQF